MRSSVVSILLLAILAAVVVVAINSAGQTPPPSSGDWMISDDTFYSSTAIDAPGGIFVRAGGRLTLVDVDLTVAGSGSPVIEVEAGGALEMNGGSLGYKSAFQPRIFLRSPNCSLRGVDLGSTYGIYAYEFGVEVSNCTLGGAGSYGVYITPVIASQSNRPIVIADNVFTNVQRTPIACSVGETGSATPGLVIVGNRITGTLYGSPINATVATAHARVVVERNVIVGAEYCGIDLTLNVGDLYLRLNGNRVTSVGDDGLRLTINAMTMDFPGIVDLAVMGAGRTGLDIRATAAPIDDLAIINHTNLGAGFAGVSLKEALNVTLVDSNVNTSAPDFLLDRSTLDIYNSLHSRSSALVTGPGAQVSSWRWIDLMCLWAGGYPVRNQRVSLLGSGNETVASAVTALSGYWGNQSYRDWYMTDTESQLHAELTAVLVHPQGNIISGTVRTDRNQKIGMLFDDPYSPVLVVRNPDGDVLQNTTELTINGSCKDAHSGVALVQFSFDPNPDWNAKTWTNVQGLEQWHVDALSLSEGTYTLYMRAADRVGLATYSFVEMAVGQVTIDLTPPVVQVTSPDARRQPVIVNTTSMQVEGWVSEEVSSVRVDRSEVPVEGRAFSLGAGLSEGLNEIRITATDLAGNSATYTFTALRDTVAPVITLNAPAPGALLNVTYVQVAGLVDEQVRSDQVVINGATATLSSGAFELLISGFDQGPGTIDVTAVDLAGNAATLSVDVFIDTLPPAVEIVSPIDGQLTSQSSVLVEGTSEAGAHITLQGASVDTTGTAFSLTVDLAEGRNVLQVTSVDKAGNLNSTLVVVIRDSTAPVLELYGVDEGTIQGEGTEAVVVGRTEPGAILWMAVEGTSLQVPVFPDGSFLQPLNLYQLETSVTMRAEDAAGNVAMADVTVLQGEIVEPTSPPTPTPVDPVVSTAVVATTSAVIIGVAMTFEFTKYALVLMVLPLYARIKKHEVLDNKTRLAIHGLVVENPGMHYNEIIREFDLTNGVAAYHLDVLEREGFVRSIRDGTMRRFYSSSTKVPGDHKATPDQTREQILEMISGNPGINQKSIVDELGIGRTLVGYHLKTLIDEGYIEAHKQGRFTVYSRTRKRWFRLN